MWGSCYVSADGSKWKKSEKVNSSQSFYQLQGLTPGSHYRLRFTYSNTTFWETDIETEGTGNMGALPSFIFISFIFSAAPLGFPLLNIKPDPTENVLQSPALPVKCFQRLMLKESLVSHIKWSITCVCLVNCAAFFLVPLWNATLSEYIMLCLFCSSIMICNVHQNADTDLN